MENPIIKDSLCTRCGACFAVDKGKYLKSDDAGFPRLKESCGGHAVSTAIETYRDVCTGENWPYLELLRSQYGRDAEYEPASPDIGIHEEIFLCSAESAGLRKRGQSGGVTTALLSFAFEIKLIDAALVVRRGDASNPFSSQPYIARSTAELTSSMGSKYTICPTLERLKEVGKDEYFAATLLPCQTVGLKRLAQVWDPELANRCQLIIGPFCGLNMETAAGPALARAIGVRPPEVTSFANRAGEFPGETTFEYGDRRTAYVDRTAHRILYRMFAPLRCYTCTDYGNELADVVVADCWEQKNGAFLYPDGAAYVVCRTERGLKFVKNALEQGRLNNLPLDAERQKKAWEASFIHRKVRGHNRIRYWAARGAPVPQLDYPLPPLFAPSKWADRVEMLAWRIFRNQALRESALRYWIKISARPKGSFGNLLFEDGKFFLFTHRYDQFQFRNVVRRLRRYGGWLKRSLVNWRQS